MRLVERVSDQSFSLVSIGMPVRNCLHTIQAAVNSILSQTYENWELILIDDGSTDGTAELIRRFDDKRIKVYCDGANQGLISRLNQALFLSRGKYFARMDGDDVAYPKRLERQVDYLETHSDIDLVGAEAVVFGLAGKLFGKRAEPEIHNTICARPYTGFPMIHPTYLGQLKWFQQFGYRSGAIRCEDQDLLLRSYSVSRFANVPEILLGYRETTVDLKKILESRWYFARSVVDWACERNSFDLAVLGVFRQTVIALIDCVAVGTRLNYHLLRHMARPVTDDERNEWTRVWQSVQARTE